ncbi:MAG TPA: aminodeoxychorismate synthase component I [Gammaproteobacteria bacterium]|nr:aminodeoxychorismate synthase component I [Gammaproteobacteria bacterium]
MDTAVDTNFVTQLLSARVDLFDLHTAHPEHYPFLLQSTAQGRYDFLFAFPGEALVLHADGGLTGPYADQADGDFLQALDRWWRNLRLQGAAADAPPFRGGWFLFLGYELAQQIEPILNLPNAPGFPIALAVRVPAAFIYDRQSHTVQRIAESEYVGLLPSMKTDAACAPMDMSSNLLAAFLNEEDPQRYLNSVARARRYICDGDIFQANLSRLWQAELAPHVTAAQLYRRLRAANPAPFAGLVRQGAHAIISSSPERLVRVQGRRVEARPIAGTRPRGTDALSDTALIRELITHPKERAEHIMLVDLERNDLGRICNTGSVHVDELMVVESYSHVHHIVSNVSGQLRPEITPGEVIRAVFPGGTITGCPKVRCMQIIAELEDSPRGAYTGAMGYLNRDGDLDLNILIRTLVQHGRQLEFRAGAGIVADSIPECELEETRAKARGLARALGGEA